MKDMNHFLRKLSEEAEIVGQEDVSRNLAKEDALRLIADFVKNVKQKFTKPADKLEILNAAEKTLRFYIDEIESDQFATGVSVGVSNFDTPTEPVPSGNFGVEDDTSDFDDDEGEDY